MGRAFRTERGRVRVELDSAERELIAQLLGQVAELLGEGEAEPAADPLAASLGLDPQDFAGAGEGDVQEPEDPALARLLPQAHRDDPELAAEFRRLTEHGLRGRKRTALTVAQQALLREPPVLLAPQEAQALLKGLTDVRLVLGERLGLRTDEDAELVQEMVRQAGSQDSPWITTAVLYDLLTWWQESLVSVLRSGRAERSGPGPGRFSGE